MRTHLLCRRHAGEMSEQVRFLYDAPCSNKKVNKCKNHFIDELVQILISLMSWEGGGGFDGIDV